MLPLGVRAQRVSSTAPDDSPATGCGVALNPPDVPFPSPPKALSPQHHTSPTRPSAQVVAPRMETSAIPSSFATRRGKLLAVVPPLPSCPTGLLPEHQTVPSAPRTKHAFENSLTLRLAMSSVCTPNKGL